MYDEGDKDKETQGIHCLFRENYVQDDKDVNEDGRWVLLQERPTVGPTFDGVEWMPVEERDGVQSRCRRGGARRRAWCVRACVCADGASADGFLFLVSCC